MLLTLSIASQIIGIVSIIQAAIIISISLAVLKKWYQYRRRILFYLFLFMYFSSSNLFPFLSGYIGWLISGGAVLPYEFYALLSNFLLPIVIIAWSLLYLSVSSVFINRKKIRRTILILISIYSIFFEIYLFYYLFFSPTAPEMAMIGILIERSDLQLRSFVLIYAISIILWNLITGIHFSFEGIKSEDPRIRVKGKILLIAFIFMFLEIVIEGFVLSGVLLNLVLERIIGGLIDIATFMLLYLGFVLPKWFQNLVKIENRD
jgi:hypothetical protein